MTACRVRFLGHATVLIDLDGTRFITDPLLRPRIPGLVHRHPIKDWHVVDGVQAILISHLHHDHLDIPSLRYLDKRALLLAPTGAAHVLHSRGIRTSAELRPADTMQVGQVRVIAIEAHHVGYRVPFGPLGGCLGFVLEGSRRIYFAGDTAVFSGMTRLAPLDLALLPIAGWGPVLGRGHMDPRQAAEALRRLRPRVAVPIHWGSLVPLGLHVKAWRYLTRPPHEFAELAARVTPDVQVRVLSPGQALDL
jgi:L-ascorbate metabolism protein UlaG (beta-lactamase superfamily)